jgi:hypothetical protein
VIHTKGYYGFLGAVTESGTMELREDDYGDVRAFA